MYPRRQLVDAMSGDGQWQGKLGNSGREGAKDLPLMARRDAAACDENAKDECPQSGEQFRASSR